MSFKLTNSFKGSLTPAIANQNLSHNNFPGQRQIKEFRLKELGEKIDNGTFRTAHVAVAQMNGSRYLVNGQHCCTLARQKCVTLTCFFEEYSCDSLDDVAHLYAQFDSNLSIRSQMDVNKPYALAYGIGDLSVSCLQACVSALVILRYGTTRGLSREQRATLLGSHVDHCRFVSALIFEPEKRQAHMKSRAATIAAILETWECSPDDAEVFWSAVRDGEMLCEDDPAYVLREWLKQIRGSAVAQTNGIRKAVSDKEIRDRCIHAWNNYRKGSKIRSLKFYPESAGPKVI